jgi:hypothetical protein
MTGPSDAPLAEGLFRKRRHSPDDQGHAGRRRSSAGDGATLFKLTTTPSVSSPSIGFERTAQESHKARELLGFLEDVRGLLHERSASF